MIAGMGLGGVWERLERLDRRILGQKAYSKRPPKHPVLMGASLILAMGLLQSLALLATGFTRAEAVGSFLTYLAGAVIATPFLVRYFRGKAKRASARDQGPQN